VDKRWHVLDEHLKGMMPVYEPERDSSGRIVYDSGVPRPQRIDGQIVGRLDIGLPLDQLAFEPLIVEDYAGNRSIVAPLALPPKLLILDVAGGEGCEGCPLDSAANPQFVDKDHAYQLDERAGCLRFHLYATVNGQAHFEYMQVEPELPGPETWLETPEFEATAGERIAWNALVATLGLEEGKTYRTRFVQRSAAGDTLSIEFWIAVHAAAWPCEAFDKHCNKYLKLCVKPEG
jgi:hypothetical protein